MIRRSVVVVAAVGLVAVGAAPQAHAGLLYSGFTKTASEKIIYPSLQNLDLTGLSGLTSEILNVDQANSGYFGANYKITGISLTFSGTFQLEGSLTNSGSSVASGYVNGGTTYTFTALNSALAMALAGISLPDSFIQNNISVPAASNGVNGSTAINLGDGPITSSGGGVSTSAIVLSQSLFGQLEYSGSTGTTTGGSTVEFAGTSGSGNSTYYGGGNGGGSGTSSGVVAAVSPYGATAISIVYTYALVPIPEPVSAVLLGSGLLGLGAMRMRRRKI
jgi:hypothetical protein